MSEQTPPIDLPNIRDERKEVAPLQVVKSPLEEILSAVDPDQYIEHLKSVPTNIATELARLKVDLYTFEADLENPHLVEAQRVELLNGIAAITQQVKFLAWRKENAEKRLTDYEELKKKATE